MKKLLCLFFCIACGLTSLLAQGEERKSDLQKIYETEKAFERTAAEKGLNQSFIEFSAADGTCFFSGPPVN